MNKKIIAGAALDVFKNEPIPHRNSLLTMKNVVTLPHIGSATNQTRSKMSQIAVQNLLNVFEAKEPIFLVNQDVKNQYIQTYKWIVERAIKTWLLSYPVKWYMYTYDNVFWDGDPS